MPKALILIDIQNDYFPGGRMELAGCDEAGEAAKRVLTAFRARKLPLFHIQHLSTHPGATFFIPETEGARTHASVAPKPGEKVFIKHYPNSFRETGLLAELRAAGITQLVLAGMMTHMCVDTTVRAAFDLGFNCELAHDACATRDLRFQETNVPAAQVQAAYLAAIGARFANVLKADDIIATLP